MENDQELSALQTAFDALKCLDDDGRKRSIEWLLQKFGIAHSKVVSAHPQNTMEESDGATLDIQESISLKKFNSLAEVFERPDFKTDAERALVAAAFLQEKQDLPDITGFEINKELKDLGHGVSNITLAMASSINRMPRWIIQTKKEGKGAQARKKYKVTMEGFKAVYSIMARDVGGDK